MRIGWTSSRIEAGSTERRTGHSPRQCAQGQDRRSAFQEYVERWPSDQVMRKGLLTTLPSSTGVGIRGLMEKLLPPGELYPSEVRPDDPSNRGPKVRLWSDSATGPVRGVVRSHLDGATYQDPGA